MSTALTYLKNHLPAKFGGITVLLVLFFSSLCFSASAVANGFFDKFEEELLASEDGEAIRQIRLSKDERFIYTLQRDAVNTFGIWSLDSDTGDASLLVTVSASDLISNVEDIAWVPVDFAVTPDDQHLLILGAFGSTTDQSLGFENSLVKLNRDTTTGTLSYDQRLEYGPDSLLSILLSPDGQFAYQLSPSLIRVTDVNSMSLVQEFEGNDDDNTTLPFGLDGAINASGTLLAIGGSPTTNVEQPALTIFSVDAGTGTITPIHLLYSTDVVNDAVATQTEFDRFGNMVFSDNDMLYTLSNAGRRLSHWMVDQQSLQLISSIDKPGIEEQGLPFVGATHFNGSVPLLISEDQRFLYIGAGTDGVSIVIALERNIQSGEFSLSGYKSDEFLRSRLLFLATTSNGRYLFTFFNGFTNGDGFQAGGIVSLDTAADLAITANDSGNSEVTAFVTNNGPTLAVGTTVQLQAGTSVTTSQSGCTGSGSSTLLCELGDIAAGSSESVEFNIASSMTEAITVTLVAESFKFDANAENNTDTATVTQDGTIISDNDNADNTGDENELGGPADNGDISSTSTDTDNSGSGGCTIVAGSPADPLLLLLMLSSTFALWRRRIRNIG